MTRPKLSFFELDKKTGLRRAPYVPGSGCYWYLIERGTIKQGKNRPIVWEREEETTYVVCPICRAINTIDTSEMIINRRDLDSNYCEICSECHSHFWCSLIGWVDIKKLKIHEEQTRGVPFL